MDLIEKCVIWNENGEYQLIVDAIESLEKEKITAELISELARAYNNIGNLKNSNGQESEEYFYKAIELLKSIEENLGSQHNWNFRIAYAYFHLDQDVKALHHFMKALESRPNDQDTMNFIEACKESLALPRFQKPFAKRVARCWDVFERKEAHLRAIIDDKNYQDLIAEFEKVLSVAFDNASFEVGFNGMKYELILTPEGDISRLYKYVYFKNHAPSSILKHWNILVGRQVEGSRNGNTPKLMLAAFDQKVSGEDVQVWLTMNENKKFVLELYCEKLALLQKENEKEVWWLFNTLLDQALGEINVMRLIEDVQILKQPKNEKFVLLKDLRDEISNCEVNLSNDPDEFLNEYLFYSLEPNKDENADLRLDIFVAMTRHAYLSIDYIDNSTFCVDEFHRDGAVAGFFYFPLYVFAGEDNYNQAVLEFRNHVQEEIERVIGDDIVCVIGGATGIYYGYIDFIAWDLMELLHKAEEVFEKTSIPWVSYHSFRRDGESFLIMDHTEDN
ncbi:tetratricopeptide repeat protein [Longibaculum muris]|uniref:tetratricopeptide repeat protein n=1 Tax=Longibaculum muris TaxID=1796628 RepID=UPI0022E0363D|nr:tetratricopeptide repeat protein [Longibaculum muris]